MSFFRQHPQFFDTKKLGGINPPTPTTHGSGSNLAAAALTMAPDNKPPPPDEIDSVPGFLMTIYSNIYD
jgi:hypothetical protein